MPKSFFEKLKRGMGIEVEEKTEERKPKKAGKEEKNKIELKVEQIEPEIEKTPPPPFSQPLPKKEELKREKWLELEGELAVDIYETSEDLVIISAIAGVKAEDLDISIEGDLLSIEGERKKPIEEEGNYFAKECYWGKFSRQIILPVEIDQNKIEAKLKNGVLIIRVLKIQREIKKKILVKE